MRLSNCFSRKKSVAHKTVPKSLYSANLVFTVFRFGLWFLQYGLFLVSVSAAPPDIHGSHLLPTLGPSLHNGAPINGDVNTRFKREAFGSSFSGETERGERSRKEFFRVELLRQINAIDHMRCFPKVLCGLSVDTDKSFGINKSNFVKSYLELMRNIKSPQEGAEERVKTEDEVEGELLWRFSPHNPDRKHHSSFERISSAAMSASDELGDSPEDISRGLDSRVIGDSSMSMEKDDRMGIAASTESKEESSSTNNKPSSSSQDTRMDSSKIPGEKKKKNSNKSLTAKLTSYFTSWLPEVSFGKDRKEDSVSKEVDSEDMKRTGKSMNDEDRVGINSNWPLSTDDFLAHLPELLEGFPVKRFINRQGKADDAPDSDDDDHVVRDDSEREADIYHTAVNIGKRLKDPKQCDYIYNGCPLEYNKIIHMISSIRTDVDPPENQAVDALSQEFGLEEEASPEPTTSTTTTTTTTTTTSTTTKRPQRKKTRPSTKIMHVLPNGEKVEINFRLGGSEDSDESSSSQRDYSSKKEYTEEQSSFEKDNKGEDEVVVVDLGQRAAMSTEEDFSSERAILSNRKGAPVDAVVVKNKSHKRKNGHSNKKKNILTDLGVESIERSGELASEHHDYRQSEISKPSPPSIVTAASFIRNKPSPLKLSGLLSSNSNEQQPLEISPSYLIFKHQPLSVHTTSPLGSLSSSSQTQPQIKPVDRLQTFQLIQNGQQIDADKITEYLKSYIRQNGGLIPKLSLHSSGLITAEPQDTFPNAPNPYMLASHLDLMSTPPQTTQKPQPQPSYYPPATLNLNSGSSAMSKLPTSHSQTQFTTTYKAPVPLSAFPSSYLSYNNHNGPEISGSVPGRFTAVAQHQKKARPTTTTTTTTTTTQEPYITQSTTTDNIILPGMAETLTLDTEEITDDTMDKLESQDSDNDHVPSWITPPPTSSLEIQRSRESDEEQEMLENLNRTYLRDNTGSKIRYKNPKKRKPPVKVNSSRVRNPTIKRKKVTNTKKGNNSESSSDESTERVVIKHAGPYSGSPTVYQSPLKGPGPHGGAYPYLMQSYGINPNKYPAYPPLWRT